MKKTFIFFALTAIIQLGCTQKKIEKPNIVWLVSEDNSIHYLNLYNPKGASMPSIEKLAKNGVVFDHAFSNAPVCSVARSTLITGCYAPRIGTQYHRKTETVPLPAGVMPFPFYLREAGYYTTNNAKQDYNFILPEGVWDESSKQATYKNRKENQPFFHVQNFHTTHEGRLHFPQKLIDNISDKELENIKPFPYHPDTKTFRYTQKHYLTLHEKMDKETGSFIENLENEGLLENTIIFYYGDHGGVLPRSKGYVYESGLNVPLVVYVPEGLKHLNPFKKGSRTQAFVEFVDFAPTVLNLSGISLPADIDGKPFLGENLTKEHLEKQNTTFGHADRFDEKYDLVRSLRVGKYKYIRNYQPFNIDGLFNFYRYKMLAYKEWDQLYSKGKLNPVQQQFYSKKAPEYLFDIENDPHETNNLANSPAHQKELLEIRKQLYDKVVSLPDLSFYPESYLLEHAFQNPVEFGQANKKELQDLIDIADLNLLDFQGAKNKIRIALKHQDPWIRYWALIVCSSFGAQAKIFESEIRSLMLNDEENLVRMRAIEYLLLNQLPIDYSLVINLLENANSETEANLMLNSLTLVKALNPSFKLGITKKLFPPEWYDKPNDLVNRRMDFIMD
jgi:arylsulfatase A-like enzyme